MPARPRAAPAPASTAPAAHCEARAIAPDGTPGSARSPAARRLAAARDAHSTRISRHTTRARSLAVSRVCASLLLVLAGASPASAAPLPERFSAEFVVEVHGITVGVTEVSLTPLDEGRAVYQSRSTTAGLLSLFRSDRVLERSELRYRPHGELRPLAYRYERRGSKRKTVTIDFDWDAEVARNTEGDRTWRFEVPDGTLDKLSYMLAVMRDLERGQRELRYPINARGRLTTYHLQVVGEERLRTRLGTLRTLKVERIRSPEDPQETTVWCAERLHYLPVKIVDRDEDGTVTTLRIRALDGLGVGPVAPEHRVAPR